MEITRDTKIGDLIPDGYELSNDTIGKEIIIYYKKKLPKTFEEYCELIKREPSKSFYRFELLQYICQDLGISNEQMFIFIYDCIVDNPLMDKFAILRDILPENFIDELIG